MIKLVLLFVIAAMAAKTTARELECQRTGYVIPLLSPDYEAIHFETVEFGGYSFKGRVDRVYAWPFTSTPTILEVTAHRILANRVFILITQIDTTEQTLKIVRGHFDRVTSMVTCPGPVFTRPFQ